MAMQLAPNGPLPYLAGREIAFLLTVQITTGHLNLNGQPVLGARCQPLVVCCREPVNFRYFTRRDIPTHLCHERSLQHWLVPNLTVESTSHITVKNHPDLTSVRRLSG